MRRMKLKAKVKSNKTSPECMEAVKEDNQRGRAGAHATKEDEQSGMTQSGAGGGAVWLTGRARGAVKVKEASSANESPALMRRI